MLLSCKEKQNPKEFEEKKNQEILVAKESAVSEYTDSLSLETKISQIFLVNVDGDEKFTPLENNSLGNPLLPGGALLFSFNISKDPLETYEFIKSIWDFYVENNNPPPFIAVDQEGGYVNRMRNLTSDLWSQKKIAGSFSISEAEKIYAAQSRQMKNLGFNVNLAPVVEIETEENKDFLDTRSFGSLSDVLSYGKIAIDAYEKNKIATVLKHFPGNSNSDPHTGLPELVLTKNELDDYLSPFKNLLPFSSAVLMSHARVSVSDDENYSESGVPCCLSKYWVSEVLKKQMGFSGLVLSDDIFMAALSKNGYPPEKACVGVIEAGIDVIMLSGKKFSSVLEFLAAKVEEDQNFSDKLDRAVKNVINFKIGLGILEMTEVAGEDKVRFQVRVKADYPYFDLNKFDEDYRDGMKMLEEDK